MPVIGEGTALVALLPGALEALVSNIRTRFAPASHSHGASGIENGAVTAAKLSADAIAALAPTASDLYDVLFEDANGSTSAHNSISGTVLGDGCEPYRRLVFRLRVDYDNKPYVASACVPVDSWWQDASSRSVVLPVSFISGGALRTHVGNGVLKTYEFGFGSEIQVVHDCSTGTSTTTTAATRTVKLTRIEGWRV